MDPITVSLAAGYVAKIGGPKIASSIASKVQRGGWARRAVRHAFRKVSRPRPVSATVKWLKLPNTLTAVLLSPDQPGVDALSDLDQHLCATSRTWRRLPQGERHQRLGIVLAIVYDEVLTEHDPRWSTRIVAGRVMESNRRTHDTVLQIQRTTEASAAKATEAEFRERIAGLPLHYRPAIVNRWHDSPAETWRVISLVTSVETEPVAVFAQWQASTPAWLGELDVPARLVAADLAWAYGARMLAAELYTSAARHGAPLAARYVARAALLLDDLDQPEAAKAVIDEFISLRSDPMFAAVAAAVQQDWDRLREVLPAWEPTDQVEQAVRFAVGVREVMLGRGESVISRESLDELINLGESEIAAGDVPGISLTVARLLLSRAQRGEADHSYADLKRAQELATATRDRQRAIRAKSDDATAVACESALAAGDFERVLALGEFGAGTATEVEAKSPQVRQCVVLARAALGRPVGDVRTEDAATTFIASRLRAALAEGAGENPLPHWEQAFSEATDDSERVTALFGMARSGAASLPGSEELAVKHPDLSKELSAVSDLAHGRISQAISALRTLAPASHSAAATLARAYRKSGDLNAEVETLRAAASDFHDPQFRLDAVLALARSDDISSARAENQELLASAPPAWPGIATAQRLGAQLAYDDGDIVGAGDLLRAALTSDPTDVTTRWNLVRVMLSRSDYPDAWRVFSAHPNPLEPVTADDARAWLQIHREFAPVEDTMRGCLRLMRQFADSEEIWAAAIASVVGPGTSQGPVREDLLAEFQQEMQAFTERWPESRFIQSVAVPEDPEQLLETMNAFVRQTPEQQRGHRELSAMVVLGQMPLGGLAAALHRSYAEVLLRRGLDVIPARHPDRSEHDACVESARAASNQTVALDTTAIIVSGLLDSADAALMQGRFQLVTVDDVLADARIARAVLTAQNVGSLQWDEQIESARFVEIDPDSAALVAEAAVKLVRDVEHVRRRPVPKEVSRRLADNNRHSPWLPLIEFAVHNQIALWADDVALRDLARSKGVSAFSTLAVLQILEDEGMLPAARREEIDRILIRGGVGDIPLLGRTSLMMELAEDEGWRPASVGGALGRPAVWADPSRAHRALEPLLRAIRANAPRELPGWMYRFTRGAAYAHADQPAAAQLAIASTLAVVAYVSGAQGSAAADLIDACRLAIRHTGYESVDPVVLAARLLYGAMNRILPSQEVAQYMFGFASALSSSDRNEIVRMVLTSPLE